MLTPKLFFTSKTCQVIFPLPNLAVMQTLKLHDYTIFIGDLGQPLRSLASEGKYTKIAVLADENSRRHCLPLLAQNADFEFDVIEIPAGEMHKNLDICRLVWQEMMRLYLDRHSLMINLGGGVVGDLGGFCAATYFRGMDFVQVPTTLLAQADASIGGKLGIDFNLVKNSIGVFQNPKAVLVEPAFLKTLPERELRSGFAEIIKHALIADAALWQDLQSLTDLRQVNWESCLTTSLQVKQSIVETDPLEKGIRKALNFGHTVGHAVESFSLQSEQPLTHGEAVALGMICESWLSHRQAGLPEAELEKIVAFLRHFFSPYLLKTNDLPQLLNLMKMDKKNIGGRVNFTLLPAIGEAQIDQFCEEKLVRECLEFYISTTR